MWLKVDDEAYCWMGRTSDMGRNGLRKEKKEKEGSMICDFEGLLGFLWDWWLRGCTEVYHIHVFLSV